MNNANYDNNKINKQQQALTNAGNSNTELPQFISTTDSRFCWATYNNIFVAGNGWVYSCCHEYSEKSRRGNIFYDSIDEVLFGERSNHLRNQMKIGQLHCNKCTSSHKSYNPNHLDESVLYDDWKANHIALLQVEVGYTCNSRCSFCQQPHMTKGKSIPFDKIKELLKVTKPTKFQLQGGEIFYNEGAVDFIEWLNENNEGIDCYMHTNCVVPTKYVDLINECFDVVSLNLYGATEQSFWAVTGMRFDSAINFITTLAKKRTTSKRSKSLELKGKFLLTPTTFHEIPLACEILANSGVDNVRFNADYGYPMDDFVKRYDNEFTARIWLRLNEVLDAIDIPVAYESLERFGFSRQPRDKALLTFKEKSLALNKQREKQYFGMNDII